MTFASPWYLLLLLTVPLVAGGWIVLERRREGGGEAWGTPALLPNLARTKPGRRRFLPLALFLLGLTFLLVGFARPQAEISSTREGATVVLVMDVSGSMQATDIRPSRLSAARAAAVKFIDDLPKKYRVGVVTFAEHTSVPVAPTYDRDRVRRVLSFSPAGEGTALGTAVQRAARVARRAVGKVSAEKARPPAAVLIFSDGAQTQGRVTPQQGARQARRLGVPVSTVLVGTPNGVVERKLPGGFTERIQVPADPDALQTIGATSGGRFYRAATLQQLKAVYEEIGSRLSHERKTREVTVAATGAALALMLAGAAFSGAWFRRLV